MPALRERSEWQRLLAGPVTWDALESFLHTLDASDVADLPLIVAAAEPNESSVAHGILVLLLARRDSRMTSGRIMSEWYDVVSAEHRRAWEAGPSIAQPPVEMRELFATDVELRFATAGGRLVVKPGETRCRILVRPRAVVRFDDESDEIDLEIRVSDDEGRVFGATASFRLGRLVLPEMSETELYSFRDNLVTIASGLRCYADHRRVALAIGSMGRTGFAFAFHLKYLPLVVDLHCQRGHDLRNGRWLSDRLAVKIRRGPFGAWSGGPTPDVWFSFSSLARRVLSSGPLEVDGDSGKRTGLELTGDRDVPQSSVRWVPE